jgi:hypothetical protein
MIHNALEIVRDPSHSKMLPQSELTKMLEQSGFEVETVDSWFNKQEFSEWIAITNSPERIESIRIVMDALAQGGIDAGINLRSEKNTILFDHKWVLMLASK